MFLGVGVVIGFIIGYVAGKLHSRHKTNIKQIQHGKNNTHQSQTIIANNTSGCIIMSNESIKMKKEDT